MYQLFMIVILFLLFFISSFATDEFNFKSEFENDFADHLRPLDQLAAASGAIIGPPAINNGTDHDAQGEENTKLTRILDLEDDGVDEQPHNGTARSGPGATDHQMAENASGGTDVKRWAPYFQPESPLVTLLCLLALIMAVLAVAVVVSLFFYSKAHAGRKDGGLRRRRRGTLRIFPKQSITI